MTEQSKYWAATPEAQFGAKLQAQLDVFHTHLESSQHLKYVGLAYTHFFGQDAEFVGADAAHVARSGEQGEIAELRVPNSRALANGVLNIVTGPKLAWQPVATTNDFASKAAVVTVSNACEYYWKDRSVESVAVSAALDAICFGEGFVFTPWDANAGEDVAGVGGQLVKNGDIAYRKVMTWDVLRDTGYPDYESLPWIAFTQQENKYDLAASYPDREQAILSSAGDFAAWKPVRNQDGSQQDTVTVVYFFHKRTPGLPHGRQSLMLLGGELLKDGPLDDAYRRFLPLHRLSSGELSGTPFPYAPYWSALGAQQLSDGLHTNLSTNITNTCGGLISAEIGSDLPVDQLAGGPKVVYRDKGSQPPVPINLQVSSSDSFKYLQMLRQEAQQLVGLNSTTMGQPDSPDLSGAAMALLSSMSIQANSVLQAKWVSFVSELGTATLHHIQTRMSEPRKIALSGKGRASLVKATELSSQLVEGVERVHVDIGNPLQQTAAGRYEIAQLNLRAGFVKTPEQLQSVQDTGRLDAMTQRLSNELLYIAQENEALGNGQQVPVSLYDDHKLHLQEHPSVGLSVEVRSNPYIVEALQAHMMEHINVLRTTDPVILAILGQQSIAPPPMPGVPGANPPGAEPPKNAQSDVSRPPEPQSQAGGMPTMPTNPQTGEKFTQAGGTNPAPVKG